MSRNYLACTRCRWITRTWGRRLDAVTAQARAADHRRFHHHPESGAAAVSAAFQQEEKSMPHHGHFDVEHAEDVAHDDANGVAALTADFLAKLEGAGHKIKSHGLIRHADGHLVSHGHHQHGHHRS